MAASGPSDPCARRQSSPLFFCCPPRFPRAATREEVLARVRAARNSADFTASARLVDVSASGERKSHPIAVKAHAFPDGLRIFCDVTAPRGPPPAVIATSTGAIVIRTGRPGDPRRRTSAAKVGAKGCWARISPTRICSRTSPVAAPDAAAGAAYGARTCAVLRSEPGPGDHTHYASVTSWLDRELSIT